MSGHSAITKSINGPIKAFVAPSARKFINQCTILSQGTFPLSGQSSNECSILSQDTFQHQEPLGNLPFKRQSSYKIPCNSLLHVQSICDAIIRYLPKRWEFVQTRNKVFTSHIPDLWDIVQPMFGPVAGYLSHRRKTESGQETILPQDLLPISAESHTIHGRIASNLLDRLPTASEVTLQS